MVSFTFFDIVIKTNLIWWPQMDGKASIYVGSLLQSPQIVKKVNHGKSELGYFKTLMHSVSYKSC